MHSLLRLQAGHERSGCSISKDSCARRSAGTQGCTATTGVFKEAAQCRQMDTGGGSGSSSSPCGPGAPSTLRSCEQFPT